MPILVGVFLFFYTKEITGNKLASNWKTFLHFLPTVLLILFGIPFFKLTGPEKITVFKSDGVGFELYETINSITIEVSGLLYSIWSLIIIRKHQKKIRNNFSNIEKKNLQWLRFLSIGFGIIWLIVIFFDDLVVFSMVVIFVLCIGTFGINQLNIFNSNDQIITIPEDKPIEEQDLKKNSEIKNSKYSKSGLSKETASEIYTDLKKLMNENAVYKNKEITLVELSKQLNVHPNYLSQIINEMEGKNFYNYINTLRINEFIKIASLPENKKFTMISLAYDCGFSTKSTFNRHFKLVTSKTPTEFFKSVNSN
ncbi:AraC family transcriptional regulator [uncultured Flavobacterium sp.]|uniref:helix-turn-helix domain-containing protein n=1 Tax=uncultured Flavobacterium sp. TaxID=165435 RepID=UPI0025FDD745|nr:helix-turn-helix domain-containing protein [uncultured Flavobacterium sp.]